MRTNLRTIKFGYYFHFYYFCAQKRNRLFMKRLFLLSIVTFKLKFVMKKFLLLLAILGSVVTTASAENKQQPDYQCDELLKAGLL